MKPFRILLVVPLLAASFFAAACGSSPQEETIDQETFIDTYVALRIAALDTDSSRIADSEREAILAQRQVTEDDLLDFVRVHATNLEYMREVWNEVELRMDQPSRVAEEG